MTKEGRRQKGRHERPCIWLGQRCGGLGPSDMFLMFTVCFTLQADPKQMLSAWQATSRHHHWVVMGTEFRSAAIQPLKPRPDSQSFALAANTLQGSSSLPKQFVALEALLAHQLSKGQLVLRFGPRVTRWVCICWEPQMQNPYANGPVLARHRCAQSAPLWQREAGSADSVCPVVCRCATENSVIVHL